MCIPGSYITEARAAWRLLNGVICVYKPLGMSSRRLQEEVRTKLAIGLNSMRVREPETLVEIKRIEGNERNSAMVGLLPGSQEPWENKRERNTELEKSLAKEVIAEIPDGPDKIQIVKGSNYADLTLVVGPRYQQQDIKTWDISRLGSDTSGMSGMNCLLLTAYMRELLKGHSPLGYSD